MTSRSYSRRRGFLLIVFLLISFLTQSTQGAFSAIRNKWLRPRQILPSSAYYAEDRSLLSPLILLSSASKDTVAVSAVVVSLLEPSVSLEKRIVRLGRRGQTDDALALYAALERPTIRQLNAAIDACARARPVRLVEAFGLFTTATSAGVVGGAVPNVYTFGALMSACARSGNVDRAMQLLNDMVAIYKVKPNAVVYSSCISACARARPVPRPDLALQLLQQAREQGMSLTVVAYNAAIAAAANAGDVEGAMALLEQMNTNTSSSNDDDDDDDDDDDSTTTTTRQTTTPTIIIPKADAVTYGTVLAACERSKDWKLVLTMAQQMKQAGFALDGIALTSILHACQQLGLAAEALEYLHQMKSLDSTNNAQQLKHQEDYTRQTAGREFLGGKKPLQGPDAVAYRLAISACARGGAWQEGIRVLQEYCEDEKFNGGDVVAYTAAITGCEYAGEWKQAFLLLERMRATGIQPNEVTFAAVIGACATATAKLVASTKTAKQQYSIKTTNNNDDDEKNAILLPQRKALQLLNVLKKDDSIVSPNIQVYNAAIRACAEAHDCNRALLLLDDLRQQGLEPTLVTYGTLMTACERIGSTQSASRVFKLMKQDNVEPNEIVYGAAISCCRKAGESERALLLLKKMIREELKPNVAVFNTVLVAQSESNPVTQQHLDRSLLAYKLLRSNEYTAATPNRQTYSILIRCFASNGQAGQAALFLKHMQKESGLFPDVDLYTITVSAYERIGQPLKALRLMEHMRADGYDFYDLPVLNAAFKKAVKLVNAVGNSWNSNDIDDDDNDDNDDDYYDYDEENENDTPFASNPTATSS